MTNSEHPTSNADRGERLIELFEQASQVAPSRRDAFLAEACGGDEQMRRELVSLLGYANDGASALPTSAIKLAARQLARAARRDWAGQQVNHYRILRMLGEGGMGEIWLAEDTRLDRQVAIKFLTATLVSDDALLHRFEQEARAASALNHPNILVVHEIGQYKEDLFIVTEFIEGQTLRHRLATSRLTVRETIDIAAQVASALNVAHSAGIFHRDIKPENIMLREDGVVKVLDFGIAKLSGEFVAPSLGGGGGFRGARLAGEPLPPEGGATNMTAVGMILGTASYMSPEQARGDEVDGRSDLFSLGAVMYEMAMGERLFAGATPVEVTEQLLRPQEPLHPAAKFGGKAKPLEPIVRKCLRRKREQRYPSAAELLGELQRLKRQLDTRLIRRVAVAISLIAALAIMAIGLVIPASIREEWIETRMHDGHTAAVRRAAFSHDGRWLATSGDDGRIIIWDFVGRRQAITLAIQGTSKHALDFSPDGRWFAYTDKKTIVIRDAKNLQNIVTVLRDYQSEVDVLNFSPDGKLLATGSNNEQKAIVWSVDGWRKLREFPDAACYRGLLFYADSRRLLAYDCIWDVKTGQRVATGHACAMAFSPDNHLTIGMEGSGNTTFFDLLLRGQVKSERTHQFFGRAAAFSHDGRFAVTGAEDIALWDVATLGVIARMEHSDNVWDLLFSPDDHWLVSTHGDGAILVWDMKRRKRVADLAGHSDKVFSVAFSPSGGRIASASGDQSVNIWNAASGLKEMALTGYPTGVNRVSFLDEDTILAADFDGDVSRRSIAMHQEPPAKLPSLFADKELVVSRDRRWAIRGTAVYDWQAQRLAFDFAPLARRPFGVSNFSPDNRWLIFTTQDGQMFRCEVGTWRVVDQVELSALDPIRSDFTLDSRQFITGCGSGEIAVWQVEPLRLKKVLGKHADHVQSISVSPEGDRVVSAGDDQTIVWWDLKRGGMLYNQVRSAPVLSVAFSPDGHQVVAGGHDKSVRVYTRRRTLWGWPIK
jgi:WD40 repeat protein/serine/threonine protein kinase